MSGSLKQFELWFKKKKAGYSHAAYYTDKYEEGWRAALEWVLDDLKAAREGFDLGLHDTINKELETKK